MQERGMTWAAPAIRAATLIVLLGMLAGRVQGYGYQVNTMGRPSAETWGPNAPGALVTAGNLRGRDMGPPQHAPVMPWASLAPRRLASSPVIMPAVTGVPTAPFPQGRNPVPASTPHPAWPRIPQSEWIHAEPWRRPTSYFSWDGPSVCRLQQPIVGPWRSSGPVGEVSARSQSQVGLR